MENELLKFIRVTRGLSQTEFAREIGVSRALISHIETGIKRVTPKTVQKVKQAFNLSGDDIKAYREFLDGVK